MIRLQIIKAGNPTNDQLERFKQYASVPSDSRDALLMNCLQRALLAVQESADVALIPCTFRLSVNDVKAFETFRLYQGGQFIADAVDSETGSPADVKCTDGLVMFKRHYRSIVITYDNVVSPYDVARFEPIAWQYATALYDGEDSKTLQNILNQVVTC